MMKLISHMFVALALVGCASHLPPFPPAVIPVSPGPNDWPDAGAAILDDNRTLEFRESSAGKRQRLIAVLVHRVRYKVLSERGLRHATMVLPVDGYSSISKVAARSVHPDGREFYLRQVDIVPRDERGRPLPVGAVGKVSITVPQARVGGLLEFQYERVFTDPDMVPVMVLGQDVPVLRSEVSLIAPANVRVDYSFGRGGRIEEPHPVQTKLPDGRDKLIFVEKSLPAFHPEPAMPHMAWVAPWVAFNVASAQVEQRMYRLENWKHIGERMQFLFESTGEIPRLEGTPAERYREIQSKLKIVSNPGVGVLPPRTTVELRTGLPVSGRDAAVLLQRSLREAGLEAYPALLASPMSPPVVDGFPSIAAFARVVVAVKAKDLLNNSLDCGSSTLLNRGVFCKIPEHGFVFVDPLCSSCRLGELAAEFTGGRALLVGMRNPRFIDVPTSVPETNLTVTHYEAQATSVGEVTGGVTFQAIGHSAAKLRDRLMDLPPDADVSHLIEGKLRREGGGTQFASGSSENARTVRKPLRLSASVKLKKVEMDYDKFSFPLKDLMGDALPATFRKVRLFPRLLPGPSRWDTTVRLALPTGYQVKAPEPVELSWSGVRFYMACEVEAEHMTCARRVELLKQITMPAHWGQFRSMADKLATLDQTKVTLYRGESGLEPSAGGELP